MTEKDTYTIFMGTLDVINEALARHKDSLPWKPLLAAADKTISSRNIGVGVYADDPSEPFDFFTVRLLNDKFELVARGKEKHDIPWRVSREYLAEVNENPAEYIEHPIKLDWEWLLSVLPDSVRAVFKD